MYLLADRFDQAQVVEIAPSIGYDAFLFPEPLTKLHGNLRESLVQIYRLTEETRRHSNHKIQSGYGP